MIKNFIYLKKGDNMERHIQFDDIIINKNSIILFVMSLLGNMLPLLTIEKSSLIYFKIDMLYKGVENYESI